MPFLVLTDKQAELFHIALDVMVDVGDDAEEEEATRELAAQFHNNRNVPMDLSVRNQTPEDQLYPVAEALLQRWYHNEIRAQAQDYIERAKSGEFVSWEDFMEIFQQDLDSHRWVMFTQFSQTVLLLSGNADAFIDNFGVEGMVDNNGNVNWAALAFFAMEQDILDQMQAEIEFDESTDASSLIELIEGEDADGDA